MHINYNYFFTSYQVGAVELHILVSWVINFIVLQKNTSGSFVHVLLDH